MQILIDELVTDDIDRISAYISQDSEYYAHKTAKEIFEKIYDLKNSIYHGRIVPELNNANIQELLYHDNYRIIFQMKDNIAYILQVLNAKQDFNKNFRFNKVKSFNSN